MNNINILNANNESINAEVIRYFSVENNNYLIYSLNEVDEQQYIKLYITKISNETGINMGVSVADEVEWESVKDAIKMIIKSNNDGNPINNDLEFSALDGITVTDSRIFKLSVALTEILKKDLPVTKQEVSTPVVEDTSSLSTNELEPTVVGQVEEEKPSVDPLDSYQINPESSTQQEAVDYEQKYNELLMENERLTNEVNNLNSKLDNIKSVIESN